jgi:hypothetical protein
VEYLAGCAEIQPFAVNLKVLDAAGGEAGRLGAVAHDADPITEEQHPAVSGVVLRTTPVVAVSAAIVQETIAGGQEPSSMKFQA